MATPEKTVYDKFADKYDSIEELPCSKLEAELIRIAIGDCTGLTVLDLGGGSGLHARRAVNAGATVVDVFDISPEMMRIGQGVEAKLGRKDRIRWFEADATRPLVEQVKKGDLRPEGYDVVMANWVFDHSTCMADLKGMWGNVVASLKPGGRFLGVRVTCPHAGYMKDGKYGNTFTDMKEIPGGLKYTVGCRTSPPFSFGATSMEPSYTLDHSIPRDLGLVDFDVIRPEEVDLVKENLEFWDEFLKEQTFTVVVAKKPKS